MAASNKVRERLAQQFLAALDQGHIPWEACWSQDRPENAVTGKTYRGVNAVALSYAADDRGYTDPRWCTYNQAQGKGWQVRKGEKSAHVEYWAYYDLKEKKLLSWQELRGKLKADPDYEKNLQLRCRIYSVFNAQQIDGIPALGERRQTDIGALREQRDILVRNMGIGYEEYGSRAFYSPSMDVVVLPPEASFDDTYSYMATFLHECGHASGASHRLNRDLSGFKGSESYAREELRAEIASAFTAQSLGLRLTPSQLEHHTQLHAAYVQHWAAILKDAPDELFRAIKAAEGISDYLIEKGEFDMEQTQQKSELKEWYIVVGNTDQLAIVPAEELRGRQVIETFRCAGLLDATKKLHRYEELQSCFWDETNDPETQEWREDLTADEAAMVEQWDLQTAKGFSKLVSDILKRSTPAEQILVAVESTDDYTDANFHSELHDLEKQNPDGSWGTVVDYYRLVKLGDSGRIEVLDKDLVFPSKAQAEAAAASIPYARLVDYDTLVHEAGKNLTAKYTLEEIPDSLDLRLRFHGYGKIQDYSSVEARPWQPQVARIREIAIGNGITQIGRNVLNDYPAVEEITWPRSITRSDPYALWNCPNLKGIAFSGEVPDRTKAHELIPPSVMLEAARRYPELTREQVTMVAKGLRDGASWDDISVYARPEFTAMQMESLRYSIQAGLTPEQIGLQADPAFDFNQMDIIRSGFQAGMSLEQVQLFAKPEIPAWEMLDVYWAIRNGQTWELPAAPSMTVVMVEPGEQARIMELPHTLKAMQEAVGGSTEAKYPFEDPVAIIRSKEDKLDGLPLNRGLYDGDGNLYDILCGPFFVAGLGSGVGADDFRSLSPELAQKYLEQFKSPEQFLRINGHIIGLKTEPENMGQALDELMASQTASQTPEPTPAAEGPALTVGG